MLDLTVPMVEVWFAGAKLGEYTNDIEALKAASLHADSLPLVSESVEYELRRDTMKYIVHRRIVGPDAPALGPVLTISSTALTVTLDRPASGPTQIDRYELERYNGAAWVQIASGLSIFGASNQYADSSLTASTAYQYRCRAVDTTSRASEYSYSSGTTSAGASNTAPVWQSGTLALSVQAGSSVALSPYCSDPEGDQITYTLVDTTPNDSTITVSQSGVLQTTAATAVGANTVVVRADDGALTASKAIALTVTAASTGQTFTILAGTATYNASAVQPGDVIIIEGDVNGNRGPLKITNANGTSGSRITVRNPTTKSVTIGATGTSTFVFEFDSSSYLTVDGSYYSGAIYGINVTVPSSTSAANALIKLTNHCRYITLANFAVDGKRTVFTGTGGLPIGVQLQHNALLADGTTWQEGHIVRNFYIRRVKGEGIYAGSNYTQNAAPMRNINIYDGLIEDTGRDGVQGKSWWSGTNSIHDIVCRRVGKNTNDEGGQRLGIDITCGQGSIYNCTVIDAGESGIRNYAQNGPNANDNTNATGARGYGAIASFPCSIYNNVVVNAGAVDTIIGGAVATGNGIVVNADSALRASAVTEIYNNTVLNCEGDGISFSSTVNGGTAQNNILLNNGSATSNGSGATVNNNLTTGTQSAIFVAPELENYHLAAEQAVTAGLTSATDIEGTSRAGTASKGAYEYS